MIGLKNCRDSNLKSYVLRTFAYDRKDMGSEDGFTLIEMLVTIVLFVILLTIAFGGLSVYFSRKGLETSATEVMTEIREAQAMAVTTGNTYRIDFSGSSTFLVQRHQGESWVTVKGPITFESDTTVSTSSPPNFSGDRLLELYARGTSEDGQLVLQGGLGGAKTLQVQGETVNIKVS